MVVPNIFSVVMAILFRTKICISPCAPGREYHITVRFTVTAALWDLSMELYFMSPSWQLEFAGGSQIYGKLVDLWYSHS
jgi:hypothetical protein